MLIMMAMCRRRGNLEQHPESKRAVDDFLRRGCLGLEFDHRTQVEYVDFMTILPWARAMSVAACLAHGADWIVIADDDVWFRSHDIASSINNGLPITGFAVPLRSSNEDTAVMNYTVFTGEKLVDPDKDWRHIVAIGCGALVVKRDVFLAMQKHRPKFTPGAFAKKYGDLPIADHLYDYFPMGVRDLEGQPHYVGEDYGFCFEAQKAGYPIFLNGTAVTAHMFGETKGLRLDYKEIREHCRTAQITELVETL